MHDPTNPAQDWLETDSIEIANIDATSAEVGVAMSCSQEPSLENTSFFYRFRSRSELEEIIDALRAAADDAWPVS